MDLTQCIVNGYIIEHHKVPKGEVTPDSVHNVFPWFFQTSNSDPRTLPVDRLHAWIEATINTVYQ